MYNWIGGALLLYESEAKNTDLLYMGESSAGIGKHTGTNGSIAAPMAREMVLDLTLRKELGFYAIVLPCNC